MAGFSDSLDIEKPAVNSDGGIFGLPWHRKKRGQLRWRDFRTSLTPKKPRSIQMAGFSDSLGAEKTAVNSDGRIFGLPWHRKNRGQLRWRDFRTPLTLKKPRSIQMAGFSDSLDIEKPAVNSDGGIFGLPWHRKNRGHWKRRHLSRTLHYQRSQKWTKGQIIL